MADKTVLETIANLKQSGLGNDEIKSMLMDIGFDEATISEAMDSSPEPKSEEIEEQNVQAQQIQEKTKGHADDAKLASSLAMNVAQATANKVDQHLEKVYNLKDMHSNLHERHDNLDERIDSIEAKLDGLTKIMKDILDNQRDILMRLR
jgi:SOS response regulatory protein OraA/RecX